jgi:hypothetical protein
MRQSLGRSPASFPILSQAIALHNAGNLAEAEAMVRHVLTFEPNHPDALNLPGSIALHGGHAAAAAGVLTQVAMLDLTEQLSDFADTAALMEAFDLIVTVDTSIVHLAGAPGRPVWLLNRFNTDWRWMLQREDSPWYPTMRIFRQATPGDWHGVLATVRRAIDDLAISDPGAA